MLFYREKKTLWLYIYYLGTYMYSYTKIVLLPQIVRSAVQYSQVIRIFDMFTSCGKTLSNFITFRD